MIFGVRVPSRGLHQTYKAKRQLHQNARVFKPCEALNFLKLRASNFTYRPVQKSPRPLTGTRGGKKKTEKAAKGGPRGSLLFRRGSRKKRTARLILGGGPPAPRLRSLVFRPLPRRPGRRRAVCTAVRTGFGMGRSTAAKQPPGPIQRGRITDKNIRRPVDRPAS